MALDETVKVVPRGVGQQAPRQLDRAQHLGGEWLTQTPEFVLEKTVVEASVMGDENAARDPRGNLAGDVGKPWCLGDHRIAYSGQRLNGGRDAAIRIDQAAPFGGMAALDPNDADFGDTVVAGGHASGFQVYKGGRVGKHRISASQGNMNRALDERSIVRYCSRYVERSFLLSRLAGLLRGSPRAAVVFVHRHVARPAVEILGGGASGAAQACRIRGINTGSAAGTDAALLPAPAGRGAGACRAAEPHR